MGQIQIYRVKGISPYDDGYQEVREDKPLPVEVWRDGSRGISGNLEHEILDVLERIQFQLSLITGVELALGEGT